jgi:hypothetical protein
LISGKQGSGKTTLAKEIGVVLSRHKSVVTIQMVFAEPLYQMHNFCLGILEDAGIKRNIVKDGRLLQLLGTEWGRETVDPDIWVKIAKARMEKQVKMKDWASLIVFVISDCRFKNEFDLFPEALTVRLTADRATRKQRCEQWRETDNHVSETDLDDYENEDKFDMGFCTAEELCSPNHMAELIAAEVLKG